MTFGAVPFGLEGRAARIVTPPAGSLRRLSRFVHPFLEIERRRGLREKFFVTSGAIVGGPLYMGGVIERHVAHF